MPIAIKEPELTRRQEQILAFIKSHIDKSGFSPTILEIQKEFSFKSPNAVQEHLKALVRKGHIRRNPNQWRGLEVIGHNNLKREAIQPSTIAVPLVGRIAAGSPILAEQNIEGMISVDRSLVHRDTNLFALHVHGDSMIRAGIHDGDIVIAEQKSVAENGEIIIALLGDEATVKRFYRKKRDVLLLPENDESAPIKITNRTDFKILGKVVASLRKMRVF